MANKLSNMSVKSSSSCEDQFDFGADDVKLNEDDEVTPLCETSSVSSFGDEECGEPECSRQLEIDFAPSANDDDYTQEKVCAFWDFLKRHPDLFGSDLFEDAEVDREVEPADFESGDHESRLMIKQLQHNIDIINNNEKSAISTLQLAEHTGMVELALGTEVCYGGAAAGPPPIREYVEGELTTAQYQASLLAENAEGSHRHSSFAVQTMCKNLDEWNKKHPKSIEPPRHLNVNDKDAKEQNE